MKLLFELRYSTRPLSNNLAFSAQTSVHWVSWHRQRPNSIISFEALLWKLAVRPNLRGVISADVLALLELRIANIGMAWKGEESEVVALATADIKWAQWMRVARNFQLRVGLKDRRKETFDGFMREVRFLVCSMLQRLTVDFPKDHDKLASLLKQHFSITLETKEISFKGWHWGITDIQGLALFLPLGLLRGLTIEVGQDLAFLVSNKTSFELPLTNVANSNIAGRTEVSLEFSNPAPSKKSKHMPDEITEIRFHVPGTHTKARGSDAGSDAEDDGEETSAAQAFHDAIKEKAEIGQVTGDLVLSFEEVLVLTPRGRYDVDMFPEFLRLRGKTYDYKILYTSISKLFLLPKDDLHVLFIVSSSSTPPASAYLHPSPRLAWSRRSHPTRADEVSILGDAIQ
jgi:structure-specific recognition protein 1